MEYARKFDKLDRKSPRVSADELKAAEAQLAPAFRKAVEVAVEEHKGLCQAADAGGKKRDSEPRFGCRADCPAARCCCRLHSRWALPPALNADDDGDSRPGGWCSFRLCYLAARGA